MLKRSKEELEVEKFEEQERSCRVFFIEAFHALMANLIRTRKRVFPLTRAPDGSAFKQCDYCGVSVPIALFDMHVCKKSGRNKRLKCKSSNTQMLKSEDENPNLKIPSLPDQPRSAFCIFMESYRKANPTEDGISVDRNGFAKWKCMSFEEKHRFIMQAERVNLAYEQGLKLEEAKFESGVDEEADSARVESIYLKYIGYDDDCVDSETFEIPPPFP